MRAHHSLTLANSYADPPIRLSLVLPAQVQTPLFASLTPPSPLVSFLAPLVSPIDIAKSVIAALDTEQSREICLPAFVGVVWALRGLPSWAREGIVWVSLLFLLHPPRWSPDGIDGAREQVEISFRSDSDDFGATVLWSERSDAYVCQGGEEEVMRSFSISVAILVRISFADSRGHSWSATIFLIPYRRNDARATTKA